MRPFIVLLAALAATLTLPAAPAAADGTDDASIVIAKGRVYSIGNFVARFYPSIRSAEAEFGRAAARTRLSRNVCRVRWDAPQLTIDFVDFGGGRGSICAGRRGKAQTFVARSPNFLTTGGLRTGMAAAEIPQRHPNATERRPGRWWLRTARPFGTRFAILKAVVSPETGTVTEIRGYFGAAGE